MLFTTTTQWVVLALALIAGWLLGIASASGGRKWRDRYAAERDAHAATRAQSDARIADARRGGDDRLVQANARIAELEAENSRLATTPVVIRGARPTEREVPGDTPAYAPDPVRPAPNVASTTVVRPGHPASTPGADGPGGGAA